MEDVHDGDGTLHNALELWASRKGPVKYNQWQSAYFTLLRLGYEDPEKEVGESRARTQMRVQRLYMEIQEELFGPDFRTQAVRASPAAGAERPVGA
eukprot:8929470-Karenia_brevis.AAC.1